MKKVLFMAVAAAAISFESCTSNTNKGEANVADSINTPTVENAKEDVTTELQSKLKSKDAEGMLNVLKTINEKIKSLQEEGKLEVGKLKGDIVFDNVTFRYEENENVFDNFSLKIKAGTNVALVGESGVGKSTICHLIPRFYEILGGKITIDNIDIREMSLSSLRKNIGIVSQDVFLFTGTIKENIAYGKLDATDEEIYRAAKYANIHDYVMTLENGYDTQVGERGIRLSGGQKQRISIARVFLANPPILILDEATSALDSITERNIQKSLDELSEGRTTLVVAHRLTTIRKADVIIVITKDGIAEMGNHEELINMKGIYYKLNQV